VKDWTALGRAVGQDVRELRRLVMEIEAADRRAFARLVRDFTAKAGPRRRRGRRRQPAAPLPAALIREHADALKKAIRLHVTAPRRCGDGAEADQGLRRICRDLGLPSTLVELAVKQLHSPTVRRQGPGYLVRQILSWKFGVRMDLIAKTLTNNSAKHSH
jgi:hypothetical protein